MPFRDNLCVCPACERALTAATVLGGDHVLRCEDCGGVFMTHETLRKLTAALGVPQAGRSQSDEAPRACPRCRRSLASARVGGVTLDICEAHGVWFDSDELRRLTIVSRG